MGRTSYTLQSELISTQDALSSTELDLAQANTTISGLNTDLASANSSITNLEANLSVTQSDLADTQSELSNTEAALVDVTANVADLEAQLEAEISQADIDAAYAAGAASVPPEDGIGQADVDAAYDAGIASVETPECEEVATQNMPLDLPQGWSMFGYTCLESLDVVEAFSDISDNIEIVKDEWGLAYYLFKVLVLETLEFGEGYQIKMLEEVTDFQFAIQL